jgi:hypothetical protein
MKGKKRKGKERNDEVRALENTRARTILSSPLKRYASSSPFFHANRAQSRMCCLYIYCYYLSSYISLSFFPSLCLFCHSYVVSPLGLHTTSSLPHSLPPSHILILIPTRIRSPINKLHHATTVRTWRLN